MRSRSRKKNRRLSENSIDMSSLMDIIFILLIFVMMSVSFTKNFKQLDIDLPQSKSGSSELSPDIQISMKADNRIYLEKEESSVDELTQFAKKGEFSNKTVSINIEKTVPYESFIKLIDLLKLGNIKKLNLGTE